MRVTDLRVDGLRNLSDIAIRPSPGLNLLIGRNGAGKTSLIEALHVFAHGRSFRSGQIDSLIRHGADRFSAFVHRVDGVGREAALGIQRNNDGWLLRQDGASVPTLIEFVRQLAVVTIEPESHVLITGSAEVRRRYLDWLLFHVEPDFFGCWRRYLRALRQRNAALRNRTADVTAPRLWEKELAASGERIDHFRRQLLDIVFGQLEPMSARLLQSCALTGVRYRSGWPGGMGLEDALAESRPSDTERGFTQRGPHRSDWRLEFSDGLPQAQLSRGQAKLMAIVCQLAQGVLYRDRTGDWPIFAFDDMASELDAGHQIAVLTWLVGTGAQVFIAGTDVPESWRPLMTERTGMFHVEQGRIAPV